MSDGKIILSDDDYSILTKLVDSLERTGRLSQPHFNRLAREMKHAVVMDRADIPSRVITMGSRVNYTCKETGTTAEAVLVFPAQAKDGESHVSILAPLGLALIGEREGTEIEYVAPGGTYQIRINKVQHTEITRTAAEA